MKKIHPDEWHAQDFSMHKNDQRQEYRLDTQLLVFIELTTGENADTTVVASKALDISTNGLRVIIDQALTPGSILRTCVQAQQPEQHFILINEVKWVEPYGSHGEYLIGLSLFESDGTDIQAWKEFIAQRCEPHQ